METRVKISSEDNIAVNKLYIQFTGYCNILGYLSNNDDANPFLDQKWAEAVQLNNELEKLKNEMYLKYQPNDGQIYTNYSFDFENEELVFTT